MRLFCIDIYEIDSSNFIYIVNQFSIISIQNQSWNQFLLKNRSSLISNAENIESFSILYATGCEMHIYVYNVQFIFFNTELNKKNCMIIVHTCEMYREECRDTETRRRLVTVLFTMKNQPSTKYDIIFPHSIYEIQVALAVPMRVYDMSRVCIGYVESDIRDVDKTR